jgi:sigma-B regulation protein RsbU (phosphoserine phosphatase)
LASVFAVVTALYSALWMYSIRQPGPLSRLGVETEFSWSERAIVVVYVYENTGAARAGLQPGDRLVAFDGVRLDSPASFDEARWRKRPGTSVSLTVERDGADGPIFLRAKLGPRPREPVSLARRIADEIVSSYPVPFLAVGLTVLFLRPRNRSAWLLAAMCAGFIAAAPILHIEPEIHPALRGFTLAYKVVFNGLVGSLFYCFFAVFPVPSPLDRRVPWLKTLLLLGTAAVVLPLGLSLLIAGRSDPLYAVAERVGATTLQWTLSVHFFGAFGLGLVSLLWNAVRAESAEARRRIRVIVWGTAAGTLPSMVLGAASVYAETSPYEFAFWFWAPSVATACLVPLSFGYAVVKHRVLEVPVLLKRSVRYLLVQRGVFYFWIFLGTPALSLFSARQFSRLFPTQAELSVGLGIAFGVLLTLVSIGGGRRFNERLDRAFFRSAYDARKILEELAQRARTATGRQGLAELMERHLEEALRPTSVAIYLEDESGGLQLVRGRAPAGLTRLDPALPELAELARRGHPWEVPPSNGNEASGLSALRPECLVPLLGRDGRLVGLLSLGSRLSEEPYSGEDKRLLASIAGQAGVALDNIRLAERMAERLEAERRGAQEMEIARQVQRKLLPQRCPPLETLEYAAGCAQARAVGGDYYDFLDLGAGRVGLVLADISGKGMSGALLMASLQANVRSRSALALHDLSGLLRSVNDVLLESTEPQHYASLFFATYDDADRTLRYVNCGHNPPLVLRRQGPAERLVASARVLGALPDWRGGVVETRLVPGDVLLLYTDGVTEARGGDDEEFGEARLLHALERHREWPASALLARILDEVREFSRGDQADDLTLLVARALPPGAPPAALTPVSMASAVACCGPRLGGLTARSRDWR